MPRPLIVIGPLPNPGEPWCAVCVAAWKMRLVELIGIDPEWIKRELDGSPDDKPKVIGAPRGAMMPPLNAGVTMMPVGAVQGMALVCWTHADALGTIPVMPPGDGAQRLIPGLS